METARFVKDTVIASLIAQSSTKSWQPVEQLERRHQEVSKVEEKADSRDPTAMLARELPPLGWIFLSLTSPRRLHLSELLVLDPLDHRLLEPELSVPVFKVRVRQPCGEVQ